MDIFYNENNPESAAMIQQFMDDDLIRRGVIDTRSIEELDPDELKRYRQCHFFAGIAGWTFALNISGWPTDRPVWTGSCPCQPFSSAGRQKGKGDDRHLWPVWERIIRECRPPTIYGEQVEKAIAHGWLDDVYKGLEPEGYAIGAGVLPACSIGSPHKRYRLWFVAHTQGQQPNGRPGEISEKTWGQEPYNCYQSGESDIGSNGLMVNSFQSRLEGQSGYDQETSQRGQASGSVAETSFFSMADSNEQRCDRQPVSVRKERGEDIEIDGSGFYNDLIWLGCGDGKTRPIKPGLPLVVNGLQFSRPILHAIGNAINPYVAAEIIKASM